MQSGNVVRLKSGGPDMTVRSFSEKDGLVYTNWFDAAEVKSGKFRPDQLELVGE